MLREGVAGRDSEVHKPPPVEGVEKLSFDLADKTSKVLSLAGEGSLIVPVAGSYAFGRLEVEGSILYVSAGRIRKLRHAAELLQLIRRREPNKNSRSHWVEFERELENGSANLALALAYRGKKAERLRRIASGCGAKTVLDLALTLQASDGNFDSALFFEQLCVEGHNLHPGAKPRCLWSRRRSTAMPRNSTGHPSSDSSGSAGTGPNRRAWAAGTWVRSCLIST